MNRNQIDPDSYMTSLMNDAKKQRIPVIAIYSVLENGKLFMRVLSNTSEEITKQLWHQISPASPAAIEAAAKALAAAENIDWATADEAHKKGFSGIASIAVAAAMRAHAPKDPDTVAPPSAILSPS